MSEPLISILIPCHNAAPWIGKALSSAKGQTWPQVEIIVVDDGSTDVSQEIAQAFASGHCSVLRQDRRGASAARNLALAHAQGDYIQYLDADDFLAPDKLEQQIRALLGHNARTLSCGSVVHFSDSAGNERGLSRLARPLDEERPEEFLIDLWSGNAREEMVQTGQWLAPQALVEKAGPWNEELSVDDDGEFFARAILAAESIVAAPQAVAYYRHFSKGKNLSACGAAGSSMRATQLKCVRLLQRTSGTSARDAVRRQITREIIKAYPAFPEVVADGLRFLREQDLQMAEEIEGSPCFSRLCPMIGWKAARRLQWHWRREEKFQHQPNGPVAGPLRCGLPREGENRRLPEYLPAAGHCSPHRATGRLRV